MKKLLVFAAAISLCCLAHSQEAESLGSHAEMTVIPRVDLNYAPGSFDLGQTSLFTLVEGNFSENLSFTFAANLVGLSDLSDLDFAWPYTSLGKSNLNNALQFLNVTYSLGNFDFTLGKDVMTCGGFEYDAWDWEVHPWFSSNLWNNLPAYQWGGKVAWNLLDGDHVFSLQGSTSPFGEKPFASGLFAGSFQYQGTFGPFSVRTNATALETCKKHFDWLFSVDGKLDLEAVVFTLDFYNIYDIAFDAEDLPVGLEAGRTYRFECGLPLGEDWTVSAHGQYAVCKADHDLNFWKAGANVEFHPGEALHVNAFGMYDGLAAAPYFGIGARYEISFNLF